MCCLLTHQEVLHSSVQHWPPPLLFLAQGCLFASLVFRKGSWSFSLSWGVKANVCLSKLWIVLIEPMIMKPSEFSQHRSKKLLGLDPLHLMGYRPLQGLILRRARLNIVSHLLEHLFVLFTKSANTVLFLAADVILYTYFTDANCM